MQAVAEAAAEFLANRRIAVTGVSRTPENHGSNAIYAAPDGAGRAEGRNTMSTLTQPDSAAVPERLSLTEWADLARSRTRRRVAILASLAVLAWAIVELVSLASRHTTGPELYGVLVAALAVAAGILNLVALNAPRTWIWVLAAVVLWAIVAIGGLGGVIAHLVGPSVEFGPVDPRPRPVLAPIVFTALGAVGGLVVIMGRRAGAYRTRTPGEEH